MIAGESDDFFTSYIKRYQRRSGSKRFITRILTKILPEHLLRQLSFELRMLFVRIFSWNASRQYRGAKDLLVNVGAGRSGKVGWVNLDGFLVEGVNCRYDARKRLPFPDSSVRAIFAEHFFEHIDYTEEVPSFLAECHRVLKIGGIVRIIVPDAEKYLRAYVEGSWQALVAMRPLDADLRDHYFHFTYNTKMELINVVFRQWQEHKFAYDFETLEFLFRRNGFSDVKKQQFGKSIDPDICIDLAERASESLYVEAVKGG